MKKNILLIIILILSRVTFSQTKKIDSLHLLIEQSHDSLKSQLYSQLAWEYRFGTPQTAIEHVQSGLQFIHESKSPKWEVELLKIKGIAYLSAANFDQAIAVLQIAIQKAIDSNDLINQAECYKKIGNAYYVKGNYSKCTDAYFNALKIAEKTNAHRNIAIIKMNIGNVYFVLKSWDQAMSYYKQSLSKLQEVNGSLEDQANALHNIALAYAEQKEILQALEYYEQVATIFKQLQLPNNLAHTYNSMGLLYTQIDDFKLAKNYYDLSMMEYEKIQGPNGKFSLYPNLAKMYLKKKNYDSSMLYAKKAYQFADSLGMLRDMYETKEILVSTHLLRNNYKHAFNEQLEKEIIRDTLYGIELDKHLSELQTKYETERKEQEIVLLQKDITIKEQQSRQQKLYIALLLLGVILLSLFVLLLFRIIKFRKRMAQMEHAKNEAEKKASEEENLRLKEEVDHKNRELVSIAMSVSDKNRILGDVLNHLKDTGSENSKKLKSVIKESMSLEDDWENLQMHFNQVHPNFFDAILKAHPKMTPLELKHCAYLKINLSIKEIARILNISHKSVQMIHYRMKKKMELPTEQTLSDYLQYL